MWWSKFWTWSEAGRKPGTGAWVRKRHGQLLVWRKKKGLLCFSSPSCSPGLHAYCFPLPQGVRWEKYVVGGRGRDRPFLTEMSPHRTQNAGALSPEVLLPQVMDSLLSHLFAVFLVTGCPLGFIVSFILQRFFFHCFKWALLDSSILILPLLVSLSQTHMHTQVQICFTGNSYASFSPADSRTVFIGPPSAATH